MMKLQAEKKLKKKIEKKAIKISKAVKIISYFEIAAAIFTFCGVLYIVKNVLDPNAFMGTLRGVYQKDYFLIYTDGGAWIAGGGTLWFMISFFRKRVESIHLSGRVDEELEIEEGKLLYKYRVLYEQNTNSRTIVASRLFYSKFTRTIRGTQYKN